MKTLNTGAQVKRVSGPANAPVDAPAFVVGKLRQKEGCGTIPKQYTALAGTVGYP
ncbi:MAG: hypothetical protein K9N51_09505 [Candidatus Pacebacteria bacterium]|nr:hypothetical protein [Candidatus Paceibacterota bacterium]